MSSSLERFSVLISAVEQATSDFRTELSSRSPAVSYEAITSAHRVELAAVDSPAKDHQLRRLRREHRLLDQATQANAHTQVQRGKPVPAAQHAPVQGSAQRPHRQTPAMKPAAAATVKASVTAAGKAAKAGPQQETRIQRFGRNILERLLSRLEEGHQTHVESLIRREFGDTPDVSKSLRLLVTEKRLLRLGKGGRADPFLYKVRRRMAGQCTQYSVLSEHFVP
ncbi:hypothetical protein WJX72_002732 [[Myrmecia] bisecta]|uniref:Uncharacterized protein n=1 Tax=[Myrmecia] bisecta TaxID=41462 RepID=A0AAW1Q6Y1_9CHLO